MEVHYEVYQYTDPSIQLTASQAILKGISPEGGLFVPEEFPQVDLDFIRGLEGLTYWERAERVMALYLDDFSREDLKACTEGAYRGTFDGDQPAPVRAAGDLRGWSCAGPNLCLQGYGTADAAPSGFHRPPQSR